MSFPTVHRVVTGHDEKGKAIVSWQGSLPTVAEIVAVPGMVFHEVWATAGSPAAIDNGGDPTIRPLRLLPPKSGTRARFEDFPPETPDVLVRGSEKSEDAFVEIGDVAALTVKADSPHPLMHRTDTGNVTATHKGQEVDTKKNTETKKPSRDFVSLMDHHSFCSIVK